MRVFFATTNKGKVLTAQDALSDFDFQLEPYELKTPEPRLDDLAEIARQKALFAYERIGEPLFTLDGGFWLNARRDFPVTSTKDVILEKNIEGILELVKGKDRSCEFRHAVAYTDEKYREPKIFESVIGGVISEQPRGTLQERNWSILHKIVIAENSNKTLAEMNREEYRKYIGSPIFKGFGEWLRKRYELE